MIARFLSFSAFLVVNNYKSTPAQNKQGLHEQSRVPGNRHRAICPMFNFFHPFCGDFELAFIGDFLRLFLSTFNNLLVLDFIPCII